MGAAPEVFKLCGSPGKEISVDGNFMGCHTAGYKKACAGWLAVHGKDHLGVRLAVSLGRISGDALSPREGWPKLFRDVWDLARHGKIKLPKGVERPSRKS